MTWYTRTRRKNDEKRIKSSGKLNYRYKKMTEPLWYSVIFLCLLLLKNKNSSYIYL